MEFRALGTLAVLRDGVEVDLGPPRQRAVLALLLIHRNEPLTADRILDEIWPGEAEGSRNALRVHVSRLRAALDPERSRGASSVLETVGSGYRLAVESHEFDVAAFEASLDRAREVLAGDPSAARVELERALELWRGDPYEDFPYDEFVQAERRRLVEARADALEIRIGIDLAAGRSGSLISELEVLREQHPLRERFVEQQARALYLAGRSTDALRAIDRHRRYVADELGLTPSPDLLRLEEQILLHDERIQPGGTTSAPPSTVNPYQGLRAFGTDDAGRFFGRDALVADILRGIRAGQRLVAVVGASGSGKSSVVRAGVVPALAKGAIEGSDGWTVATMVPGAHPFVELAGALGRATAGTPADPAQRHADDDRWLLGSALRLLPDDSSRLVLVVDQFEELFTLVDDAAVRTAFLSNLVTALDDAHRRVVVIVALRADFYAEPLAHPEFGARLGTGVVNVTPLTSEELATAARSPSEQVGVTVEPALLGELIGDLGGHTTALPLFQYALTELYDRRDGDVLTVASYRALGGLDGALRRRADDLLDELDPSERNAAKQLFLRLVLVMDDGTNVRRRVPARDVLSLDVESAALEHVVDAFGRHRLLTFDMDQLTGSPTVEIAHEALLTSWPTLTSWIEESRDDLRRQASLAVAVREWHLADEDPAFLWSGARLTDLDGWLAGTELQLNEAERRFVAASRNRTSELEAEEAERRRSESQSRWILAAVAGVVAVAIAGVGAFALGAFDDGSEAVPEAEILAEIEAESERVAEQFVAAVSDRDSVSGDKLLTPGAQISISPVSPVEAVVKEVTLGEQIAWLNAWDWSWESDGCAAWYTSTQPDIEQPWVSERPEGGVPFDAKVACTVTSRNLLSDHDETSRSHSVDIWLLDGRITYAAARTGDLQLWMPSLQRFTSWAETERSELWAQAWNDDGPLLTRSSAEIEGRLLDEYIALAGEE